MSSIILGAQFGDEGKGKLTDWLCERANVCVRFNGGSNAGHTIRVGEQLYYVHLLPSGLIHPQVVGVLGNGVVVNLRALLREIADLSAAGVEVRDRLLVSNRAQLTLLAHCLIDEVEGRLIGTTKQGIGPTYADKAGRHGVRLGDLLKDDWPQRVKAVYDYHDDLLSRYFEQQRFVYENHRGEPVECASAAELYERDVRLIRDVLPIIQPMIADTVSYLNRSSSMLIEGANAMMLDVDFGTYPYVTSSSCTIGGVLTGTGLRPQALAAAEKIGVFKCYVTRVGGGCLPTEIRDEVGEQIQRRGNEVGVTTKRKRRCGWLDLPQLAYACRVNGFDCLNITKLDILSFLDKVRVCVGYQLDGAPVDEYPCDEEQLSKVTPVYEELDGWNEEDLPLRGCHRFEDLHPSIRSFIERIEQYVGVPVKYINTGQERSNIIVRELS